MGRFEGKTALISGASAGIGRQIAEDFLREGEGHFRVAARAGYRG